MKRLCRYKVVSGKQGWWFFSPLFPDGFRTLGCLAWTVLLFSIVSSPDIYKTIFFTGNYWMKSALSLQPNPLYLILTHIWVWQMWHRNISGPRESVELNGGRKRALFLWLGTNWRVMPSRSWLLLQPQVEWVTWRPCLYIFPLKVSSPEQWAFSVESDWFAANMLPGENQYIFIPWYF